MSSAEMKTVPLGPPDSPALRLVLFAGHDDPFAPLRRHAEASVYAGGLLDAAGNLHELLEIWVQRVGGFAAAYPTINWTNAMLDQRWSSLREEIATADGTAMLRLAIEDQAGRPVLLDKSLEPLAAAAEWELCRNEVALKASGLPTYAGSLHRYLQNRGTGEWIALTADAPLNGVAKSWHDAFPEAVAFNPEGGRIFVRPAGVIPWRAFAACLRGECWRAEMPKAWLKGLPPVYLELAEETAGEGRWRHFLLPSVGAGALGAEEFYLRLALLHDAVETIATTTARRGAPFLNLDEAHFGVRLSDGGRGLPSLWSARVTLNRGGGAVLTSDRHYLADATASPGPYRLPGPLHTLRTTASLRVRRVADPADGYATVEATLQTDQPLSGPDGFRLEIHFETAAGVVVLPGEMASGASPREWLFAGKIPADRAALLVGGATHPQVDLLLHPKLGSACDLYALGVLGLQLFLESPERPLAAVLDDALLLRDRLPPEVAAAGMAPEVGRLLAEFTGLCPPDAGPLWPETLACLIRMLGGEGRAFFFQSAADRLDEPPEAIHRAPLAEIAGLVAKARTRVFGSQDRDREVRDEILRLAAELRGASG